MVNLRALANRVITTLFQPPCAACGTIHDHPLDGAVCGRCWASILPLTPPLCLACGEPLPSWRAASLSASICPRCRRRPRLVRGMAAVGAYDGALRAIIHAVKYDGRRSAAPPLSRLMREAGQTVLSGADAVVPVPLHARREWSRGFNQAALLARGLAMPVRPVLTRVLNTAPQVDLPAARRHRNVRHAFALATGTAFDRAQAGIAAMLQRRGAGTSVPASQGRRPLQGLTLVLVDDVLTTGATLEACAAVLISAGAREVRALTAARVLTPPTVRLPPPRPSPAPRR